MSSWYTEIESNLSLEQGDMIFNCPIVLQPITGEPETWQDFDIRLYNVIILTQSCDLVNGKISLVQVCPFVTLEEFCAQNPNFSDYRSKENIRRGYLAGYHILNKCDYFGTDSLLIVDFKSTYSVSFDYLNEFKERVPNRTRINSPYKEHLSQAYARFFMRVGLPSDIPQFTKKSK